MLIWQPGSRWNKSKWWCNLNIQTNPARSQIHLPSCSVLLTGAAFIFWNGSLIHVFSSMNLGTTKQTWHLSCFRAVLFLLSPWSSVPLWSRNRGNIGCQPDFKQGGHCVDLSDKQDPWNTLCLLFPYRNTEWQWLVALTGKQYKKQALNRLWQFFVKGLSRLTWWSLWITSWPGWTHGCHCSLLVFTTMVITFKMHSKPPDAWGHQLSHGKFSWFESKP